MTVTERITIDIGQAVLGGRFARPASGDDVGLVVALHGGSFSSAYFDIPGQDGTSIDHYVGAGFSVAALDRPGYAGSAIGAAGDFRAQANALTAAVEHLAAHRGDGGGPVYLVGHSIGGMLALMVAANLPDRSLTAVAVSGLGVVWQPGVREMWESLLAAGPMVTIPDDARTGLMLEAGRFDPGILPAAAADSHPIPVDELRGALEWPDGMEAVVSGVTAPVLHLLAEKDRVWASDDTAVKELEQVYAACPGSTTVEVHPGVGHCIDLHIDGYTHHDKIARFLREQWGVA